MSIRVIWRWLITGLIGGLPCMPAWGDDLSSFVGVWTSVNPPGPHMIFTRIGDTVEGSIPGIGQGVITRSGGEGASNYKLSAQGLSCSYFVIINDFGQFKEMIWELKGGSTACPQSAYFKSVSRPPPPPPSPTPPTFGTTYWIQDGSKLLMKSYGDKVDIYYEELNAEVSAAGAVKGSVKFNGYKKGNFYNGIAYVYTKHCRFKPFGYQVSGTENLDGDVLILAGVSPRVNPYTCEIHDFNGTRYRLEFHRLPDVAPPDDRTARVKPKDSIR